MERLVLEIFLFLSLAQIGDQDVASTDRFVPKEKHPSTQ
jgi:hypothetical protein